MKKVHPWGGLLMAVLLALSGVFSAYATETELEDAKKKASAIEQEKEKVENTLKNLESLKGDAAAYVKQLDASLEELDSELEELEQQIAAKTLEVESSREELEAAEEKERHQYEAMKLRIRYMYEEGEVTFLELLFQSKSLGQLLNRSEYIRQISEYDRHMMDLYIETREEAALWKSQLETEQAELAALQESTQAKQQSVELLLEDKSRELASYEAEISAAQGQIDEYERDLKAQEAQIAQIEAEIKRKEEEARKAAEAANRSYKTVALGDIKFIWPCPSSGRITSGFGARNSPTEGASSNHQGIDIGAASGSSVLAAAGGEVIISTYSYSAGNYVMINHGGGVYTVYMHCSKLLVSVGDTVSQGQEIAKVGSTGVSTGPHLHFGIRTDGKYVDPTLYVSP